MPRHKDEADWSGVVLKSTLVTGSSSRSRFVHNGYRYATEGEWLIAQMLDAQGIPFTPDVKFVIDASKKSRGQKTPKGSVYVPDFIFNCQAYIWTDPETGAEQLIHGIEAKGMTRRTARTGYRKIHLLWQLRRINIKLLTTEEAQEFMDGQGLPLKPFKTKD